MKHERLLPITPPSSQLTVHAMFVEMIEEISLLRLVEAGQHVLGVQQGADDAHQLHGGPHVCVADHALDYNVHQQPVVVRGVDLQCGQVRDERGER